MNTIQGRQCGELLVLVRNIFKNTNSCDKVFVICCQICCWLLIFLWLSKCQESQYINQREISTFLTDFLMCSLYNSRLRLLIISLSVTGILQEVTCRDTRSLLQSCSLTQHWKESLQYPLEAVSLAHLLSAVVQLEVCDRDCAGSNLQRYEIIAAVLQSDLALKGGPAVSPWGREPRPLTQCCSTAGSLWQGLCR